MRSNSKVKVIYHTGAWGGNFGDSILQQSIYYHLSELSQDELEFRYINCQQIEFTDELIQEINKQGDLLLIGGGGLVFYRPQDNSKSGWQWNIDIDLIDAIKIPFVVYGVGYNQFEYDNSNFIAVTNQHLIKTVEKAALFSVRNSGTKRDLIVRGCDGDKIQVIPDSGMFLANKPIEIPNLKSSGLKIAFNWTTDRENQTFPEPYIESKERFLADLIELFNGAIKKWNAQIVYIGHMGKEFDCAIIERLKGELMSSPLIIDEELAFLYPPAGERAGYLVDVYRQMDVVLGMRGHANIVSFGQNTPFIGLGSHRKIRYFLEDINRSQYFYDVRPGETQYTLDAMIKCLEKIVNDLPQQKTELKRELECQKKIFIEFNRELLTLL